MRNCALGGALLCVLLGALPSAEADTIASVNNTGAGVAQTVAPGFVTGSNALTFNVRNSPSSGANLNPVGLPVDLPSALPTPIPEPATFVLVGFACVGLGALRFRRKT
jgi:hypothetical protein